MTKDQSAAWTLYGIEPKDNTFRDGGEQLHRAYWRYIALAGVARFRWRCNAGLDRNGAGLTGIKESTFRRGRLRSHTGRGNALNPPLVPALGLSRTEELIRGRGFVDHAEWYWLTDPVTGLHWGQVLLWHREGAGHLPVRDVIGWSQDDEDELERLGHDWWYHYQNGALLATAVKKAGLEKPKTWATVPPKYEVIGRTDFENFTFGIGGTKERAEKALAEGYHSGFSRKTPGGHTYGPKPSAPPPVAPAPPRPQPIRPNLGVPVPERFVAHGARIDEKQRAKVEELAARHSLTPDQYRAQAEQVLKEATESGALYVRVSSGHIPAIVGDGRFKTQFETGRSSAMLDPPRRRDVEERSMGLPEGLPNHERPVYGYLAPRSTEGVGPDSGVNLQHYGDAVFRVKEEARNRARITVGDSLNKIEHTQSSPVERPALRSLALTMGTTDDLLELRRHNEPGKILAMLARQNKYNEVQYMGGLKLSDIAEVLFGRDPTDEVKAALARGGIPWRVWQPD